MRTKENRGSTAEIKMETILVLEALSSVARGPSR